MICIPIGNPSLLQVQLSEAAGCSDMLNGTHYDEMPRKALPLSVASA